MITVIKNVQSCGGTSLARFCHTATSSSVGATNSYVANAVCPQMPKSIHANLDILDKRRHGHGRELKMKQLPFLCWDVFVENQCRERQSAQTTEPLVLWCIHFTKHTKPAAVASSSHSNRSIPWSSLCCDLPGSPQPLCDVRRVSLIPSADFGHDTEKHTERKREISSWR